MLSLLATLLLLLLSTQHISAFLLNPTHTPHPTSSISAETLNELSPTLPAPPLNLLEADRAFSTAQIYEKSGFFRQALQSFHESATLYQCYLDHPSAFSYVTSHNATSARAVLAYACVRLAHLNHDALGDTMAGSRLYQKAIEIDTSPSAVSFDGLGTTCEGAGVMRKIAIEHYEEAFKISPGVGNVAFHLAVAYERDGWELDAKAIFDRMRAEGGAGANSLVDSWGYVRWHMRKRTDSNLHMGTREMLQIGLDAAKGIIDKGGLVVEFGVSSGRSIRMMAEMLPREKTIYGFDTFTGLPQAWGNEPIGTYTTGGQKPAVPENVKLIKGLFSETVVEFLKQKEVARDPIAFANIDCDLYSSTRDVLEALQPRIIKGTILAFDEYICHPTWRNDEFRAFRECCKRFGWNYEYLGFSLTSKQALVRIL
ncbi:hypothetical protein TrLO_g11851 [Triparma laevis f. longispina]|uniref:Uncharacterized protein n=1 Tax=Triparma laevis f. longispina TaxID=1714387 RepID=A0A9W7FQJ0_9STRA|nr:hypothetical protein TrLO_g11851 [Triparma laevis f. longispina]